MEKIPRTKGATAKPISLPCQPQCNPTTRMIVIAISSTFLPVENSVKDQGLFLSLHIIMVISLFMIHQTVTGKMITHIGVTFSRSAMGSRNKVQATVSNDRLTRGIVCAAVKNCRYSVLSRL